MDRTLIWQLAFRYLRGKRSANAVPILSRISMIAIAVSSAAMIIVLSVFNGLESAVKAQYKAFYPDIKITAARGKFFQLDAAKLAAIKQIQGISVLAYVIEDNAFVNNHNQQKVVTLKGIENSYFDVTDAQEFIVSGDSTISDSAHTAIIGMLTMKELGVDIHNVYNFIELLYMNPTVKNPELDPLSAFSSLKLHPAGVFRVQEEFDGKYMLAPLAQVQELFMAKGKYSSIELRTAPGSERSIKEQLQKLLGNAFTVETRYEQNKSIYLVMSLEKWVIYVILLFVLLIASFNQVGALSMLVLEKQKDIAILKAMGAQQSTIRRIFLLEGVLWSMVGGLSGILFGGAISFAQQQFGFIKMGSSFLPEVYPVELHLPDFGLVFLTILIVGLLMAWGPSIRATKASDPTLKAT